MRRFSQRNSLVTLSDINITPLLDLAFVLLIIFVITTPLLEKGLDLQLPTGVGHEDPRLEKNNIHTVEVSVQGYYVLDHKPIKFEQLSKSLETILRANPKISVFIRADKNVKLQFVAEVFDLCGRLNIPISLRADGRPTP
jgi:biopolymer transport protein ExbD